MLCGICTGCGSHQRQIKSNICRIKSAKFYYFCAPLLTLCTMANSAQNSARTELQNSDIPTYVSISAQSQPSLLSYLVIHCSVPNSHLKSTNLPTAISYHNKAHNNNKIVTTQTDWPRGLHLYADVTYSI